MVYLFFFILKQFYFLIGTKIIWRLLLDQLNKFIFLLFVEIFLFCYWNSEFFRFFSLFFFSFLFLFIFYFLLSYSCRWVWQSNLSTARFLYNYNMCTRTATPESFRLRIGQNLDLNPESQLRSRSSNLYLCMRIKNTNTQGSQRGTFWPQFFRIQIQSLRSYFTDFNILKIVAVFGLKNWKNYFFVYFVMFLR